MTTLRSGSATDVGKVRITNQDVALEEAGLFAVADGMGGHAGGEVAARLAVDSLRAAFRNAPTVEGLRRAVVEANRAVWRQGQSQSGLRGMGTTLTVTALVEDPGGRQVVALANVGDSRAYVYSRGQVVQVTADHSLAEEKVRQGQLTEAEAAVHPHRHVLTRALGVSSDVDVDLWELHLHDGDRILLCSDGLTNEVGDERIGEVLGSVQDPSDAAKKLVKAALDHGGSDNVTCVVIDVGDSGSSVVPRAGARSKGARAAPLSAGAEEGANGAEEGAGRDGREATTAADVESPGEGNAIEATGEEEPSGTSTSGQPRPLRVLSGTGTETRGRGAPVKKWSGAGRGGPTTAFAVPNGAGVAETGGRAAGSVRASARLEAAELRRLQPRRERRRGRRRVSGASRLFTARLLLFVVLFLAVVGAGYVALRWYSMDEWYVGIDHGRLAVYQGRPGGFLWFKPRLVDKSKLTTHEVLAYRLPQLRSDHQEASLAAAKSYMANLHAEYQAATILPTGRTPKTRPASGARTPGTAPGTTPGTAPGTATSTTLTTSTSASAFSVPVGVWQ